MPLKGRLSKLRENFFYCSHRSHDKLISRKALLYPANIYHEERPRKMDVPRDYYTGCDPEGSEV